MKQIPSVISSSTRKIFSELDILNLKAIAVRRLSIIIIWFRRFAELFQNETVGFLDVAKNLFVEEAGEKLLSKPNVS